VAFDLGTPTHDQGPPSASWGKLGRVHLDLTRFAAELHIAAVRAGA
jgi:hypothetical protein